MIEEGYGCWSVLMSGRLGCGDISGVEAGIAGMPGLLSGYGSIGSLLSAWVLCWEVQCGCCAGGEDEPGDARRGGG